jgi:hypothetical protein
MDPEELSQLALKLVSRHFAIGCLITIAIWGLGVFIFDRNGKKRVRDALVYFLLIGSTATVLAFRPPGIPTSFSVWEPITWFCFTMLLIFELFWTTYVLEGIYRALQHLFARRDHLDDPGRHRRLENPPPY